MNHWVLCLSIVSCVAWQDARAETTTFIRGLNAAGACQSASPVFDADIRKRPKAVQNDGSAPAFVTCAFTSDNPPTSVSVHASSNDGQPHVLSCNGIPGVHGDAVPAVVKTAGLAADGSKTLFKWTAEAWTKGADAFPSRQFSMSCALDPGVGLNDIRIQFDHDLGA